MLLRMAAQLVHLPEVERLSPRVLRILGGNPGKFTLQGTNTYLIGQGPSRILLDTAEGKPAWLTSLKQVLTSESCTVSTCLLSHWHPDHVQGVPDLLSHAPSTHIYKHTPELNGSSSWQAIAHGQKFTTEGATLRAVHCPGHTKDHVAFVLEEEDAMFTGDNVLGQGTAVFEDLATYMKSLEVMKGEFKGRAYPAHGPVLDEGKAKVEEYIEHRHERERQILDAMKGELGGHQGGVTPMEIVKVVYKDYPENLHAPAEGGVKQVLDKLGKEGKCIEESGKWRTAEGSSL